MITQEKKAEIIRNIKEVSFTICKDAKLNGMKNMTPFIIDQWISVIDGAKKVLDNKIVEYYCSEGGRLAVPYKWHKLENHPAIATTRSGLKNIRFKKPALFQTAG